MGARAWMSAVRKRFNLDSEVEMYMEHRHGARRLANSLIWTRAARVSAQISHHAGVVNWGFMVFLLSGFGTYMKVPLFWVSWVVLAIETVVLSTLQPFFSWLEDEVLHPPLEDLPTQNPTGIQKTETEESKDTDRFIWQKAAAMRVEGTGSTILTELIMFYKLWTPFLKLPLVVALLILITSPGSFTGELCAKDSTCYLRLKESLIAMIALFFALEYFPCILAVTLATTDIPTLIASKLKATDIWVSIIADTCTLFRSTTPKSIASLKSKILSDSISLTEVLAWEIRLMQGRAVSKETKLLVERISTTIWHQEFYRMVSFFTSSFSAVLTLTVALLVGGSFGSFMTRKTYWVCWAFVSTEALAESMLYISFFVGSGIRRLVRVSWVVRFVVHAVLFGLMVGVLATGEYYAADVRPECDEICSERGIGLLKVSCALSGIQCLSFVTSWYAWYLLTALHTVASLFSFLFRKLMAVLGVPLTVLMGYVLPLFCRAVVRSLLWVKEHLLCRSQQVSTSEEKASNVDPFSSQNALTA